MQKTWFTIFVPSQSSTTVVVSTENAPSTAPLVVKGYDVSGEVQSDSEPMKGVSFLLYSASVTQEVKGFITFIAQPQKDDPHKITLNKCHCII